MPAHTGDGVHTVSPRMYSFTVTDANGCSTTTTGSVDQPTLLTASNTVGSIGGFGATTPQTERDSGGRPLYTGDGAHTVSAGPYSFTVTDANGCSTTTTGSVAQPPLLTASNTVGSIGCFGGTTTVRVRGCGVFFKDTATTEIYALSLHDALPISDANGCSTTTTGSVDQPTLLTASNTVGS